MRPARARSFFFSRPPRPDPPPGDPSPLPRAPTRGARVPWQACQPCRRPRRPTPPATEATSATATASVVGVWCFRAVYTSDTANYTGDDDSSNGECFAVQDSSSVATHQIWLPNDQATVTSTGGTNVSGTVTFE